MIRRVLINLLDNALKYTPSGGYIDCRVKAELTAETDRAPGIGCVVSDSGPGIPPEHRNEIFERFVRTNRGGAQIRGTGLGLAFCRLAIRAHGGDIWMVNQEAWGEQIRFLAARHTNFSGSIWFYVAGASVIWPAARFIFSTME